MALGDLVKVVVIAVVEVDVGRKLAVGLADATDGRRRGAVAKRLGVETEVAAK